MPLPEAADGRSLGFNRSFAVILLSVIVGAAVGFIVQTAFVGLKLLELRLGWILFAVGICLSVRLALKPLLGPRLDLNKITQSTIPVWKHPAIWSFALGLASTQFGRMPQLNWNAIRHAAGWAAIDFIGMYVTMVFTYWGLSPAKWERGA
jgi:hypothetical protein